MRSRACLVAGAVAAVLLFPAAVLASERELDQDAAPASVREIATPIQRVFPKEEEREPVFPWLRQQLQALPPFFADSRIEARFRTYYLRQDRTVDFLSEAWAIGGSLAYRSGWLADLLQLELEGFTSQPLVAPDSRPGTLLLEPIQKGYGVLGIANGKLRYNGLVLTGGRQYLDLPYLNRKDSRMTPITFESLVLERPEGEVRFSAGYTWKVKLRSSDRFLPLSETFGLTQDRGLAHAGVVWDPHEDFHIGAIGGVLPDLLAAVYTELGVGCDLADGVELRFDAQFGFQTDIGKDLLGSVVDDAWNLGLRGSTSYAGAVFRLGFSISGDDGSIIAPFGSNPSYVDLMQRTFVRADEKALLASVSYDFSRLGAHGLSAIVNFVAGFDGRLLGIRRDGQEIDVTLDYRVKGGILNGLWLRLRGSWLHEQKRPQDGSDVRVILRYDLPVI